MIWGRVDKATKLEGTPEGLLKANCVPSKGLKAFC